jgi:hypothetical protein
MKYEKKAIMEAYNKVISEDLGYSTQSDVIDFLYTRNYHSILDRFDNQRFHSTDSIIDFLQSTELPEEDLDKIIDMISPTVNEGWQDEIPDRRVVFDEYEFDERLSTMEEEDGIYTIKNYMITCGEGDERLIVSSLDSNTMMVNFLNGESVAIGEQGNIQTWRHYE